MNISYKNNPFLVILFHILKNYLSCSLLIFVFFIYCSENPKSSAESNPGIVTDIDGNVYNTVKIGEQWWLVDNLKVTRFRNGDSIPNITDHSQWTDLSSAAYCNYNNDINNVSSYGRLYNWFVVHDSRNIAPEGWHVATDEEWKDLEKHLGMNPSDIDYIGFRGRDEASILKEGDFAALPAGFCGLDGHFNNIGNLGYWWTASEFCRLNAWYRALTIGSNMVNRNFDSKIYGFSVRCVRD